MTGKQHKAQNVGGPVITITTIRHSLQWHTLSSRTVKPLILFSLFFTSLLFVSCSHSIVTPEDKPVLSVEPDEATCTQVWVKLKVSSPVSGYKYKLYRNGSMLGYFTTPPADTVIVDEPLTPNYRCEYELIAEKDGTSSVSSGKRVISTLDTTSHNFTATTYEFGNYDNSIFRDVTIIDENNIWVAGEVYHTDSMGTTFRLPHNLFHWNGNIWEWKKVLFPAACPWRENEYSFPAYCLSRNAQKDLVINGGNSVTFYDGYRQNKKYCENRSMRALWSDNIGITIGVGYNGEITKYNGITWEAMQSGTNLPLYDVWGDTLSGEIWATGYNDEIGRTVLLRYIEGQWRKVYEGSILDLNNGMEISHLTGVWSNSKYFIYLTNFGGILRQPSQNNLSISQVAKRHYDLLSSIRGTNHNNVFVCGQHGVIGHYNGVTYKEYPELYNNQVYYFKMAVKGNLAVAVGYRYGGITSVKAVITVLRRN